MRLDFLSMHLEVYTKILFQLDYVVPSGFNKSI